MNTKNITIRLKFNSIKNIHFLKGNNLLPKKKMGNPTQQKKKEENTPSH